MVKIMKEKFKTYGNVFDNYTLRNLFKLSTQGYFDELTSRISMGKEANIFSAKKGRSHVIVKIYRLETADFNRMYDYIKQDPRYLRLRRTKRQIIFSWCHREYKNLMKAREAHVRVPMPIAFKDNILIMEFIGHDDVALQLKDQYPENVEKYFDDIVKQMKKLYNAGLVHADLSQFNILNLNDKPVLIDFSQATPLQNTEAGQYLRRDVRNICTFFKKLGLDKDVDEVIVHITRI